VRLDGRAEDEIRPVELLPNWVSAPAGSALVRQGATWVLCTVTVESRVPIWMRGRGRGWLTATYNMLPGATTERTERDRRGPTGRTQEIERLIGRSLRAAVALDRTGERTFRVDCDVLQADGGTRTAAIGGGWLALALALGAPARALDGDGPLAEQVAAISVGVVDGEVLLDLSYGEDVRAETDMNVVMAADGRFIEVQGTAESQPFDRRQLDRMLDLAADGIRAVMSAQEEVLLAR